MKIFKIIFFYLLIFQAHIFSAQEEFKIDNNFKSIDLKNYISVYNTLDSINPNLLIENDTIKWKKNKVSYGFSNELFWLKFNLKNVSSSQSDLYLEVNNPHLRYIEFYELVDSKLVLKYRCGRHMPFDSRPVDNVKFIFPINLKELEDKYYYLKIDKRKSSVSFPITLWNKNEFTKIYNKVNLFNGVYFGGLILAILYSLIAFFYIRRNLYLYYCLYIVFVGLYMFTSAGYSFQYLAKDSLAFNSYFRVVTLTLMIFFHAKFLQNLFKTKLYTKRLHSFINLIANSLLFVTVFWLIYDQFQKGFVTLYLKTNYTLILILLISFLVACFNVYSKLKKIVRLYLLSFSAIILVGILLLFLEYGWFSMLRTDISPLYIGSLIEVVILSIVLISEMQSILKEKENLSVKIVEKQQEIVQAYIDGIEKEKLRISEELHDDIGSKLSNLNQFVAKEDLFSAKARKRIEEVISDVRNISHKLSPNNKALFSFKEQIENIVEEGLFNSDIEYSLNIYESYSFLEENQKLNIYRIIQEFIQNAIKHSKAKKIEIEINKLDDSILLTIEDNGIGFNLDDKKNGLGLINIQNRVDYLKGQIEVSSILNKGTFVLISIPIKL